MKMDDVNYRKEAFLHPWNLWFLIGGLAGALGISALFSSGAVFPVILILTFAVELLVLGTVPSNTQFRNFVDRKRARSLAKAPSNMEMYRQLGRTSQRRYVRLRDVQKKVETNYQKFTYSAQPILEDHISKLNQLRTSFLHFLHEFERQIMIREGLKEEDLLSAMAKLKEEIQYDAERIRNIKLRRLRILKGRLDRYRKSQEQLEIIEAQLATIEDVVMYIHEQSSTMRDPEEITYQLDLLLNDIENAEATVTATEDVFQSPMDFDDLDVDWLDTPVQRARA